jgi:hypothetical protein
MFFLQDSCNRGGGRVSPGTQTMVRFRLEGEAYPRLKSPGSVRRGTERWATPLDAFCNGMPSET